MSKIPHIEKLDTLNDGRVKINSAIDNANEAKVDSSEALGTANQALNNSESTQDQLNQVVIEGDSSVEAAQARINLRGDTFDTLKNRIDNLDREFEERGVNVDWFGAVGDGITDDTQAFKDAASYCNSIDGVFFIPNKRYFVTEGVEVETSLTCDGVIVTPNAGGDEVIKFSRSKQQITLDPNDLPNLKEGSTKIDSILGHKGAVLGLFSDEILIKRNLITDAEELADPYYKREVSLVTDDEGNITPALDYTYLNREDLTAILFPKESPTIVTGLKIEVQGEDATNRYLLHVNRSHMDFFGLEINSEKNRLKGAIIMTSSVDVNFYSARVSGCDPDLFGYGINIDTSALVSLENCHMHDARHPVTGRHGKAVRIVGGSYSSQIDCHYGSGYTIDGVHLHMDANHAYIPYAGKDITIINSTFTGNGVSLLAIRNDTPELYGSVIIKDNKLHLTSPYIRMLAHRNLSETNDFDYERVIKNPDYTRISNNIFNLPSSSRIHLVEIGVNRLYPQETWGKVYIDKNKVINNNPVTAFYSSKDDTIYEGESTFLVIKDIEFNPQGNHDDLNFESVPIRILDNTPSEDLTDDHQFKIVVENCERVATIVDGNCAEDIRMYKSSIVSLRKTGKDYYTGEYWFDGCRFIDTHFSSSNPYNFNHCYFEGTMTSSYTGSPFSSLNNQTRTSLNLLVKKGVNFYPPLNKIDEDIYETN